MNKIRYKLAGWLMRWAFKIVPEKRLGASAQIGNVRYMFCSQKEDR